MSPVALLYNINVEFLSLESQFFKRKSVEFIQRCPTCPFAKHRCPDPEMFPSSEQFASRSQREKARVRWLLPCKICLGLNIQIYKKINILKHCTLSWSCVKSIQASKLSQNLPIKLFDGIWEDHPLVRVAEESIFGDVHKRHDTLFWDHHVVKAEQTWKHENFVRKVYIEIHWDTFCTPQDLHITWMWIQPGQIHQ